VYVVDSAGALILDEVTARIDAIREEIDGEAQVGFHGHQNLSLGVANSIAAIRAGAQQIDAAGRGFGAGAGNTPTEALVATCERLGIETGIDLMLLADAVEEVVRPAMDGEVILDRMALMMGYAGVYSSFLKHAYRAAERYGVPGAELLRRCGERRLVGGQEDMIIDVAIQLAADRQAAEAALAAG
jgi:4-hydroxy 2-oxovalerate aldolase